MHGGALARAHCDAQGRRSNVSPGDQLQFQQKNVAAQMQELTERMYRLGELTREAEPDDSARLLLAVRKARESLIIEQMKEILGQLNGQEPDARDRRTETGDRQARRIEATALECRSGPSRADRANEKLQAAIAKLDAAIKEEQRQHDRAGQLAELQKKGSGDPKSMNALQQEQQKKPRVDGRSCQDGQRIRAARRERQWRLSVARARRCPAPKRAWAAPSPATRRPAEAGR